MKPFRCFRTVVLLISLLVLVTGCTQIEEKTLESSMVIRGYILEIKEGRMLVAEDVSKSEYAEISDKTTRELGEEGIPLIYLTYDKSINVKVGDEVEAWVDGIDDSYPAQSHAKKIKVKE